MMSKYIQNSLPYISFLTEIASNTQRTSILKQATRDQTLAIAEIILNFLGGTLGDVAYYKIQMLKPHKAIFRNIVNNDKSEWRKTRNLIARNGKAVSQLLQIAREVLGF